jgi:hypothetical protein
MALWSNTDANTSAPKYFVAGGLGVNRNGDQLFGNTQLSAFVTSAAIGTFGVDSTEASNTTGEGKSVQHAGWNLRKAGSGKVLSITASAGATSPDGNVLITFTGGGTGTSAANAQITVNSVSKVIQTIRMISGGNYTSTPTAAAVNAVGTFTVTMGGRANRVQYETLVAMGSMTGDGSDDTQFPE